MSPQTWGLGGRLRWRSLPKPDRPFQHLRQILFTDISFRHPQQQIIGPVIRKIQHKPVHYQKRFRHRKSRPFVAVDGRMILR